MLELPQQQTDKETTSKVSSNYTIPKIGFSRENYFLIYAFTHKDFT